MPGLLFLPLKVYDFPEFDVPETIKQIKLKLSNQNLDDFSILI